MRMNCTVLLHCTSKGVVLQLANVLSEFDFLQDEERNSGIANLPAAQNPVPVSAPAPTPSPLIEFPQDDEVITT